MLKAESWKGLEKEKELFHLFSYVHFVQVEVNNSERTVLSPKCPNALELATLHP